MTNDYEKDSEKKPKELLEKSRIEQIIELEEIKKKSFKKCVSIYDFFEIYKLYEEDDE